MSSNKRWTLEKREEALRRALISDAPQNIITRAAEHVRRAQLALLKKAEMKLAPVIFEAVCTASMPRRFLVARQ